MRSTTHKTSARTQPEEVLRRFSYAEEFRTRKRPNLWLYIAEELMVLAIGGFFIFRGDVPFSSCLSPVFIGIAIFGAYAAWTRAGPVCPHCKKNIQMCRAVYCHVCGEALEAGRCERCDVLQSWTHIFAPLSETTGNTHSIRYCPSCAVLLDTDFRRWLGGGGDG